MSKKKKRNVPTRTCAKCGQTKVVMLFRKPRYAPDGYTYGGLCVTCEAGRLEKPGKPDGATREPGPDGSVTLTVGPEEARRLRREIVRGALNKWLTEIEAE